MKEEATARPWLTANGQEVDGDSTLVLYGKDLAGRIRPVAYVPDYDAEGEYNAALIVQAVNSHQALVDCLTGVLEQLEIWGSGDGPLANDVRAALKLAGEAE